MLLLILVFIQAQAIQAQVAHTTLNDQYVYGDAGVGYNWTFAIVEIDSNGDNLNESIAVTPSVEFNTTVDSYFFDLEISIYWLNTSSNQYEETYDQLDLLNATVQENEIFSTTYEFQFWGPGLFQVNVSVTDSFTFETIEHSQNVTMEGSISNDPYLIDYYSQPTDIDGNGCNETIEFAFSILSYNLSNNIFLSLTVTNSTGNVTVNVFENIGVNGFYSVRKWSYSFTPSSEDTFILNFTATLDGETVIFTQVSEWTANCTIETFDATSFLNDTQEPIQETGVVTEIVGNTSTSRTFVLSLSVMPIAVVVFAFATMTLIHTYRRVKKHE